MDPCMDAVEDNQSTEYNRCTVCNNENEQVTHEDKLIFMKLFPPNYKYCFCDYTIQNGNISCISVRLPISTEEGARTWFSQFQDMSLTTMRVNRTYPHSGRKNVFKITYRCQHQTRSRVTAKEKFSTKNTNCKASAIIIVKRTSVKYSRSTDMHAKEYPMIVKMDFCHNHVLDSADALRHRDVADNTKQKFIMLFENSHSPSSALDTHKHDMQCEHQDRYVYVAADRAIVPDLQWCYRLYYKTFNQAYGSKGGEQLLSDLNEWVEKHNDGKPQPEIKIKTTDDNQLVVAIFSPLMQRVSHEFEQSGEMLFVDSSGNMDRHNCRVFLMMTHSCVGGLPVGCLITTSETASTVLDALQLYKALLCESSFKGRGQQGPVIIMTDDSDSERMALTKAFPEANIILCSFHVLQALWRWLWMGKNTIASIDRQHFFFLVKSMVYADTVENLERRFQEATADPKVKKYQNFLKHINKIYDRREEWAICYRVNVPVRDNNTNNYCEAAMRVLKDKILMRTKAFNILQLIDFIFTRLESYYERKVIDIANNRLDVVKMSRFMPNDPNIPPENIIQISDSEFVVPSESKQDQTYTVNMTVGMCTCPVGCRGAPCKHQASVVKKFNVPSCNFLPIRHPMERRRLHYVATGQLLELSWFSTLTDSPSAHENAVSIEENDPRMEDNEERMDDSASVQDSSDIENNSASAGGAEDSSETDNDHTALLDEYHTVCKDMESTIKSRLQTDASITFIPAIKAFINSAKRLKNDSSLISALSTFGRYSGHEVRNRKRSHLASLKKIGVQPTAVARRKRLHVGGRKCDQRGRPCARSSEHVSKCTRKTALLPSVLPRKTRTPAPHNMQVCVSRNTGLGKAHIKK